MGRLDTFRSKARMGLRSRRGFALILVFSMASIVLLLGLSLVSLTQVETASSQYDQGLKVARANARLALQLAIGDLQEFAGPDQRVTASADGTRTDGTNPAETTFNLPAIDGVEQPFWTGVWDTNNSTDNPIWLVTRPVDAIYTIADNSDQDADPTLTAATGYKPSGSQDDLVKLVGVGSAKPEPTGGNQSVHDVWVPKEALVSDEIVGLSTTEQATIGHYAYWVGDEGLKASYLIEDDLPEVLHDGYESAGSPTLEQVRLRQMLAHRYRFDVDGTEVDATDARIASIASDLILRKEVEGAPTGRSYLGMALGTYTQNDVLRRFHDFTGMSRGLLVDTVRGGLKEDLSNIHAVTTGNGAVDDLVNNYLMPYLNVSDIPMTSPTVLTRRYTIAAGDPSFASGPTPTIAPVISEFWLDVRLAAPKLGVGGPPGGALGPPGGGSESERRRSNIYGQFSVSVELWNPYSSRIDGVDLTIRIENPNTAGLVVNYYDDWVGGDPPTSIYAPADLGLEDIMNNVSEFQLNASGTSWEPGEVKAFSGTFDPGFGTLELTSGVTFPIDASYYYEIPPPQLLTFESSTEVYTSDRIELVGPPWTPIVALRTSAGDELRQYVLSGVSYFEMKSGIQRLFASAPAPPVPQFVFSYKWEMRNPDSNWTNYDPRSGQLTEAVLMDSFLDPNPDPPTGYNALTLNHFEYPGALFPHSNSTLIGSSTELLGFNDDASIENNIPMFELPRQEFLSLGGLHMAEFPSGLRSHLGASNSSISPTASINDVFDRFFLSTVPESGTSWTVADPLPNSRMAPLTGAAVPDLQDPDAAEYLFLYGSFNVNSTSVEGWTSFLKGIRLETWTYDDEDDLYNPPGVLDDLNLAGQNQFLRFSQSAEETWVGEYNSSDDLEASRELFRKGLRSLTDAEIETLSEEIVRAIRTRRQAASAPMGPFVSLQDFIDSGVIETAIAAAGLNSAVEVSGTPLVYASSYLTQQDILTAIAPYLSARSDTFVIRAYGDAVNPFDNAEVLARAYCEAIVQRVHEKHSSESSSDPLTATDNTVGAFGRNYQIIAFRWMTGDEI